MKRQRINYECLILFILLEFLLIYYAFLLYPIIWGNFPIELKAQWGNFPINMQEPITFLGKFSHQLNKRRKTI